MPNNLIVQGIERTSSLCFSIGYGITASFSPRSEKKSEGNADLTTTEARQGEVAVVSNAVAQRIRYGEQSDNSRLSRSKQPNR